MNEVYKGPSAEELEQQAQNEQYEAWMSEHPELSVASEVLIECGPMIVEFEGLISSFEATYSLDELHSIVDLTPEEAPNHPLREPAKKALIPVVDLLTKLKNKTDISTEKYEELRMEYKKLSRAVGMINNNKVDHDR